MDKQFIHFYTWKDIDRFCRLNRDEWKDSFFNIDVYPYEIVFQKRESESDDINILENLFGHHFIKDERAVRLDLGEKILPIIEEEAEGEMVEKIMRPLFEDVLYYKSAYPLSTKKLKQIIKPVIAFHSFKGGVGRTLSAIAFAKAWSEIITAESRSKLLIIDADIEAPGLSWFQEKQYTPQHDTLSYLDLLDLLQDSINIDETVELVSSIISQSTIQIETKSRIAEHFFVPLYRYKEQLFDIYANPKSIAEHRDKQYILATFISKLCQKLKAGAAIVDLRAGISSYSATLLFDPRVKKYIVSSTSAQSVEGTCMILENILKGLDITESTVIPEIFLNMIPAQFPDNDINAIVERFQRIYETKASLGSDSLIDNTVVPLQFASELIHQSSLEQICHALNDRQFFNKIEKVVRDNYVVSNKKADNSREEKLKNIRNIADSQLTAESGGNMDILLTEPLRKMERRFRNEIPRLVILGAKGSGKTFLFQKMIDANSWSGFCNTLSMNDKDFEHNGYFIPFLASMNINNMKDALQRCIINVRHDISTADVDEGVFLETRKRITAAVSESQRFDADVWERFFAEAFNPSFSSLRDVNDALNKCNKKIVFIIDGLEELFHSAELSNQEKNAIKSLCQEILSNIQIRYPNIGIIIFLRRDLAKASITSNYEQFEQSYRDFSLKWAASEALRLALWLVNRAVPDFYSGKNTIDSAPMEIINSHLEKLWGLKLGKSTSNEAYSSRWILAALSDFNGQLQARDMIRFLREASVPGKTPAPYNDRLLMPKEIREAIQNCSEKKLQEVRDEYPSLSSALQKIETLAERQNKLPINPEDVSFEPIEEKRMIEEGFLRKIDDKYYVPESIRAGLNLVYARGARPKVLALMNSKYKW